MSFAERAKRMEEGLRKLLVEATKQLDAHPARAPGVAQELADGIHLLKKEAWVSTGQSPDRLNPCCEIPLSKTIGCVVMRGNDGKDQVQDTDR